MALHIPANSDWRNAKSNRVVSNINSARKFRKFTDVTFVVGPKDDTYVIKAHRVVLGTASAELAKLLSESNNSEWIRIADVSPIGFKNLIRYFYDAAVKFSDLTSVLETHLVAERFKAYKLKLAAENCLSQAVNYESTLEMMEIAIQFNIPDLRWKCLNIISTKYQDVLKSDELALASFEVIEAVLSNPCIGEECQYHALEAIGKWKKTNETDQKQIESLLKCVDFTQIRMSFFNDFFEENAEILSSDDIKALEKYILKKDVSLAPKWYQKGEERKTGMEKISCEKDDETNAEALKEDTSEMKFLEYLEKQKLKVQEALNKELRDMGECIMKAADVSVECNERAIKQTSKEILDYFTDLIKAVDTSVECVEGGMSCLQRFKEGMEKENIKFAIGEKESDATMEVASSDIDMLPKSEYDSIEGNRALLKCADSVEVCEMLDMKRRATSFLTECR